MQRQIENQTTLSVRRLINSEPDRTLINDVIAASDDYSVLVTGAPKQLGDADSTLANRPPNGLLENKFVLGFFRGDEMVGFADIYRGWNAPHKAHIGFLLLSPLHRGHGVGNNALAHITALAKTWVGIDTLRIGVVANNTRGLTFWRKMGFVETGDLKKAVKPFVADILVFEKSICSFPKTF